MLQAILYKSWKQHPTKQQLYGHLPPGSLHIDVQMLADQQELIYNSSVQTQDVI